MLLRKTNDAAKMFVLVTNNEEKIKEVELVLKGSGIKFEVLRAEKPELRSDDPCEIVKVAAKTFCEKIRKPVVVEDSGLFIDALKGFPGTCTAYAFKRIGNRGILKLMKGVKKGVKNRRCWYKSAIGYCEPGKEPVCFLGGEEGKIAGKEKGKNGWGQDPIFIPKGKSRTYGELRKQGDVNLFRKIAIDKLKSYIEGR
ncbi:non-canonical purine NTP pyrophosphatase [Candidatus Woesearchaeota archaeon]|nr:non-canonical purine NTP pyrophosphatase [Candidatus Woesearchaeota archaeon]